MPPVESQRWQQLERYRDKIVRGRDTCIRVAMSEEVLGYDASAAEYRLLYAELFDSYLWLLETLPVLTSGT